MPVCTFAFYVFHNEALSTVSPPTLSDLAVLDKWPGTPLSGLSSPVRDFPPSHAFPFAISCFTFLITLLGIPHIRSSFSNMSARTEAYLSERSPITVLTPLKPLAISLEYPLELGLIVYLFIQYLHFRLFGWCYQIPLHQFRQCLKRNQPVFSSD